MNPPSKNQVIIWTDKRRKILQTLHASLQQAASEGLLPELWTFLPSKMLCNLCGVNAASAQRKITDGQVRESILAHHLRSVLRVCASVQSATAAYIDAVEALRSLDYLESSPGSNTLVGYYYVDPSQSPEA